MLEYLKLKDVGPAPSMKINFAPRLNFLMGDNGLGKSFLLDIAWWALTKTWAGHDAAPNREGEPEPSIEFRCPSTPAEVSEFDWTAQEWLTSPGGPPASGITVYARVDGGFGVWDSRRNYWKAARTERDPAFLFDHDHVWDGLTGANGKPVCRGLIADWTIWQQEGGEAFALLKQVLEGLSPSEDEKLVPGPLVRVAIDDVRDHPTLKMPYGQTVPLVYTSAGMKRVVTLAYLLVWTWQEHLRAVELQKGKLDPKIVLLIDEIEAHLHPQWQRRIVPSLLSVMNMLTGNHATPVQLIAATHSPLVLASLEPHFDQARDAIFHLDLVKSRVELHPVAWAKQGDVVNWLVSETFGLEQARSIEAERAIEAAEAWMRGDCEALPKDLASRDAIHKELCRVLAGHDPFWPRWVVWVEQREQGSE